MIDHRAFMGPARDAGPWDCVWSAVVHGALDWHLRRQGRVVDLGDPPLELVRIGGVRFRACMDHLAARGVACRGSTGLRLRVPRAWRVTGLPAIRDALASGPVSAGLRLYAGAFGPAAWRGGLLPEPGAGESELWPHAVCLSGFDGTGFFCKNCWGPEWGDQGFGRIGFAYWERHGLETWTLDYAAVEPVPA